MHSLLTHGAQCPLVPEVTQMRALMTACPVCQILICAPGAGSAPPDILHENHEIEGSA